MIKYKNGLVDNRLCVTTIEENNKKYAVVLDQEDNIFKKLLIEDYDMPFNQIVGVATIDHDKIDDIHKQACRQYYNDDFRVGDTVRIVRECHKHFGQDIVVTKVRHALSHIGNERTFLHYNENDCIDTPAVLSVCYFRI